MVNIAVNDRAGREIVFYQPFLRRRLFYPKTDEATTLYPRIRRTREEGERDLIDIAAKNGGEVAWLYSEDAGEWYCVSFPNKGAEAGIWNLDFDFSKLGRKLTHYHTHPTSRPEDEKNYEQLIATERFKQQFGVFGTGSIDEDKVKGTVRKHIAVSYALPSPNDIGSMKSQLRETKAELSFGIASPHGITDMRWDPEAEITMEMLSSLWFSSIENMEDIHDPEGALSEGEYVQRVMEEINRDLAGVPRRSRLGKVEISFRPIAGTLLSV